MFRQHCSVGQILLNTDNLCLYDLDASLAMSWTLRLRLGVGMVIVKLSHFEPTVFLRRCLCGARWPVIPVVAVVAHHRNGRS